jgi:hypothetical protein
VSFGRVKLVFLLKLNEMTRRRARKKKNLRGDRRKRYLIADRNEESSGNEYLIE